MNRAQLLARAAAAHSAWLDEHADDVEAVPADSMPHEGDGGPSDYAEHHADRSAPAAVDDLLSRELAQLLGHPVPESTDTDGGDVETEEADRAVDDAGDVILEAGWVPPVRVRDIAEAGSDRKLRAYWVRGAGAAKIGWDTDGDFTRCVAELGEHVTDPKGLCAEYHKAATGKWPAEK